MKNRNVYFEDSAFERFESRMKNWVSSCSSRPWCLTVVQMKVYTLMHELLQSQISSSFIFMVLVFVESIQFLWYAVHPNMSFLWDTEAGDYFRVAIKYLQVLSVLKVRL